MPDAVREQTVKMMAVPKAPLGSTDTKPDATTEVKVEPKAAEEI